MRATLLISLLVLSVYDSFAQTTYFQQNFDVGGTPANYVSGTPNAGQFNGTSGGTITNGTLQFAKPISVTTTAHFARNTDFAPTPSSLYIQMDIEVVASSTVAAENALTFYVGEGFTSSVTGAANASVHSRFGINLSTNASDFAVRHVESTASRSRNSPVFSGKQTLTFVVNNSGQTITYLRPDGGTDTLANDRYDLWVGSTSVFDGFLPLTPTNNLSDFKLRYDDRGNATVQFDNFLIRDITGTLPVTLTRFSGKAQGPQVDLSWETANEQNSSRFVIERSPDAREFADIGSVEASGDADGQRTYGFSDLSPVAGTNYYRLRQIDRDGTSSLSKIAAVEVNPNVPGLTLLDNPGAGTSVTFRPANLPGATYLLSTLTGRNVPSQQRETPKGEVTLLPQHPLPSGVYLLSAATGAIRLTRRVLVR